MFDEIDADNSGDITEIELFDWLKMNNVEVDLCTAAAIIQFFDIDGDGTITFEEVTEKNKGREFGAGMFCLPTGINDKVPSKFFEPERGISSKIHFFEESVQLRKKRPLKKKKNVIHFLGKETIKYNH